MGKGNTNVERAGLVPNIFPGERKTPTTNRVPHLQQRVVFWPEYRLNATEYIEKARLKGLLGWDRDILKAEGIKTSFWVEEESVK